MPTLRRLWAGGESPRPTPRSMLAELGTLSDARAPERKPSFGHHLAWKRSCWRYSEADAGEQRRDRAASLRALQSLSLGQDAGRPSEARGGMAAGAWMGRPRARISRGPELAGGSDISRARALPAGVG